MMNHRKIENHFTEYIINLVGPTEESDKQKEEKFNNIKDLITKILIEEKIDFIPHIYCFGSYPIKTYLQDSDLDVTIIFEDKEKKSFVTNYSYEFLNKILLLIQSKLEYMNSVEATPIFTEINLIFADIKLLKFKYENLSFDISINNFVGLSKLIFIKQLDNIFKEKFCNELIFKRSLILIKAWCSYEGCILGSNIGLMASYLLEVLIAFVFNNYFNLIHNEFDAFVLFFEVINKVDWEKEILTLFGTMTIEGFSEKIKLGNYVKLFENSSDLILNSETIYGYIQKFEKFKDFDKVQNFNTANKIISIKNMNVIDPIFINNNLGKSVNFHNFSKIRKVFDLGYKEIKKIIQMRKSCDAFEYLNLLLNLFSKSLPNFYSDMMYCNIISPKIVISTKPSNLTYEEERIKKNFSPVDKKFFFHQENHDVSYYPSDNYNENLFPSDLGENIIKSFNKLFLDKEKNPSIVEEDKSSSISTSSLKRKNLNSSGLTANREIIDFIMTQEKTQNGFLLKEQIYKFPDFYEISELEDILKSL